MAKKKSKLSQFALYVVLGICVLAMGGFGITGVFSRSNSATVANVGTETVSADDYLRSFQNEIGRVSQQFGTTISVDQAIAFGLDGNVLQNLIQDAAFDGETNRLGISVGDETVRDILLSTRGFQGLDGNFDPAVYDMFLDRNAFDSKEYENLLRQGASQQILVDTLAAGVTLPQEATLPIFEYLGETRSFNYVRLDESNIVGTIPDATPTDVTAYYEANPDEFTQALTRDVTYASLIPSELAELTIVPVEEVNALYDDRSEDYTSEEKRFVERIVFGSLEEANEAVLKIVAEEATFESIAEDRGLALAALDLGDVARRDLSNEAADLLFETKEPGVYGPAMDDLGPAIYRVNAAIDAQQIPLEEVYEDLEQEVAMEMALAQIASDVDRIIDLVAGGATPEELAESTDMALGQISWVENESDGIAAYSEFRDEAASAEIGEERDIVELADGGILFLRVDGITEPFVKPLEDVREDVIAAVAAKNTNDKIRQRAEQIMAAIEGSGGSLTDFANNLELEFAGDVARTSTLSDLPPEIVNTIFDMETGDTAIVDDVNGVVLVELWSTSPFDPTDADTAAAISSVEGERNSQLTQDVMSYFGRALVIDAEPTLNQERIDTLHEQLQYQ